MDCRDGFGDAIDDDGGAVRKCGVLPWDAGTQVLAPFTVLIGPVGARMLAGMMVVLDVVARARVG